MVLKVKFHVFNIGEDVDIGNIEEDIDNINEFFFDSRKE